MPGYAELLSADFGALTVASDSWEDTETAVRDVENDHRDVADSLLDGEEWVGESAESAAATFSSTLEQFWGAEGEARLIADYLYKGATALQRIQRSLKQVVEDVEADPHLTISSSGRVSYAGGDSIDAQEPDQRRNIEETVETWNARVRELVQAAQEADEHWAQQLRGIAQEGNDSPWAGSALPFTGFNTDLDQDIPEDDPAAANAWWNSLPEERQNDLIQRHPELIGNTDGIPAEARDSANRLNLPQLIDDLEGREDEESQRKLEGLRRIEERLEEDNDPPMYVVGLGLEGNGRAIISFGNPDTADNVSSYIPGLDTQLDASFANGTVDRAQHTAEGAERAAPGADTASMVWLGYDAPTFEGSGINPFSDDSKKWDVMTSANAEAGAPAYQKFMDGIDATKKSDDVHVTAIGHSYGSHTLGMASQEEGGIAADSVVIVGSPGTGVDHADDFGVGKDNVYVGAAANDLVTHLPSQTEVAVAGVAGRLPFWSYQLLAQDNDLWFGTDPASSEFGGNRFRVDPGPSLVEGGLEAHSNYFNPEEDPRSAANIAAVVAGREDRIREEEHR